MEKKLQFSQESNPDQTLFVLQGALTLEGLFAIQSAFRSDEAPLTIVDMAAVPYVDSAGIGALVNAHISRDSRGRRFVLVGVNKRVKETLEITKVASVLHFAETMAEAAQRSH